MNDEKCEFCGKVVKSHNLVNVDFGGGEYVTLCNDCNNEDMGMLYGISNMSDFINNYTVIDSEGQEHYFEIRNRIYPAGICWEANEIMNGELSGYQFAVHAEVEADQNEALQKLYEKIRKGLSKKHLKKDTIYGHELYSIIGNEIIGRIESKDGEPVFIIDGREYSLEQLGKVLLSCEGWNFKLNVLDLAEGL